MKTVLKLGDKVSATYGNVTVEGIIEGFGDGWIFLYFETLQDLGNRIESEGVGIRPSDRASVRLIEGGPALTEDKIVTMPVGVGGGAWLRKSA